MSSQKVFKVNGATLLIHYIGLQEAKKSLTSVCDAACQGVCLTLNSQDGLVALFQDVQLCFASVKYRKDKVFKVLIHRIFISSGESFRVPNETRKDTEEAGFISDSLSAFYWKTKRSCSTDSRYSVKSLDEYQIHSPIIMFICPFHIKMVYNWWWRTSTHPFADGDSFFGQGLGVGHVVLHNGLEQLVLVLSIERRLQVEGRDIKSVVGVSFIIVHWMSTLFSWHLFFFFTAESKVSLCRT